MIVIAIIIIVAVVVVSIVNIVVGCSYNSVVVISCSCSLSLVTECHFYTACVWGNVIVYKCAYACECGCVSIGVYLMIVIKLFFPPSLSGSLPCNQNIFLGLFLLCLQRNEMM